MSKILRADDIVWYNCADGSWGGCESDSLIVIRKADMTDDELALLDEADEYYRDPYAVIRDAHERIEREKAS